MRAHIGSRPLDSLLYYSIGFFFTILDMMKCLMRTCVRCTSLRGLFEYIVSTLWHEVVSVDTSVKMLSVVHLLRWHWKTSVLVQDYRAQFFLMLPCLILIICALDVHVGRECIQVSLGLRVLLAVLLFSLPVVLYLCASEVIRPTFRSTEEDKA